MLRALFRVVLIIIIVAAIAAFYIGYRTANRDEPATSGAVGTIGDQVDVDAARRRGAEIGARVAEGANDARQLAADAAITAKIKSKMALDDSVDASRIDVDTSGGVVTLRGNVASQLHRERALQLARETDEVTSVVDELSIR